MNFVLVSYHTITTIIICIFYTVRVETVQLLMVKVLL